MRSLMFSLGLVSLSSVQALTVQITWQQQPVCSHAIGALSVFVTGGVAPYTVLWSNGSTLSMITGLTAGTYSVTVTDSNAEEATAEYTLEAATEWTMGMGSHNYCAGQGPYGHISAGFFLASSDPFTTDLSAVFPLNINADHSSFFNPDVSPPWMGHGYILHGSYAFEPITFTDATGCPGTITGQTLGPVEWPTLSSLEVAPSCGPSPNGSITVFRSGGSNSSLHGPDNTTFWDTGTDQEEVFYNVPSGAHWLVQTTRTPASNSINWDYLPAAQCADSIYVVVPDAGPSCGELSGTVYIDVDENCTLDAGEIGAGHQILKLEPGPRYVSTDFNGIYSANVPLGTYTITAANEALQPVCPAEATVTSLIVPVELDVPVIGMAGPMPDLWATMVSGPARPGFELVYSMRAQNLNYGASGTVTATFTADAVTSIISVEPTPDLITGQTVIWNLPEVPPYSLPWFQVRVQVPADVGLIGTYLTAGWSLSSPSLDLNPANNSTTLNTLVTGSYDPNDKVATTSSRTSDDLYFIDQDEWIDYTIRFQNTGTDTAFNVVVSDTLGAVMDPASLQIGAASHPFTWELRYGNVLVFRFDDILLPDSSVNEVASHGQVTFQIKPRLPLQPGTLISNTANIYFDFNPPVITEPSVLTAEFSTGEQGVEEVALHVFPVQSSDRLNIRSGTERTPEALVIHASDGRLVEQRSWNTPLGQLDVSNYPPGVYHLQVIYQDGSSGSVRFVR